MPYRLVGKADEQADAILLRTARRWGTDGAARYDRLFLAAFAAIAADPAGPGSRPIDGVEAVWTYHLRLARRALAVDQRVREPRHIVIYRLANDGTVEILGLAHDRQHIGQAAKRARRDAER